jgi:hypothetical protein
MAGETDEPILTADFAQQLTTTEAASDQLHEWANALLANEDVDAHVVQAAMNGIAGGLQSHGHDSEWSSGKAQLSMELLKMVREAVEDQQVDWWEARDVLDDASWVCHQEALRNHGERKSRSDVLKEIREDYDGDPQAWYEDLGGDAGGE